MLASEGIRYRLSKNIQRNSLSFPGHFEYEVHSADLRGIPANSVDAATAICKDLLEFILSFLLEMTFRNET